VKTEAEHPFELALRKSTSILINDTNKVALTWQRMDTALRIQVCIVLVLVKVP